MILIYNAKKAVAICWLFKIIVRFLVGKEINSCPIQSTLCDYYIPNLDDAFGKTQQMLKFEDKTSSNGKLKLLMSSKIDIIKNI